jgi:hypothetical protein
MSFVEQWETANLEMDQLFSFGMISGLAQTEALLLCITQIFGSSALWKLRISHPSLN